MPKLNLNIRTGHEAVNFNNAVKEVHNLVYRKFGFLLISMVNQVFQSEVEVLNIEFELGFAIAVGY